MIPVHKLHHLLGELVDMKLTLSNKLYGLIGMILAVLALVSLIAFFSMRHLTHEYQDMAQVDAYQQNVAMESRIQLGECSAGL